MVYFSRELTAAERNVDWERIDKLQKTSLKQFQSASKRIAKDLGDDLLSNLRVVHSVFDVPKLLAAKRVQHRMNEIESLVRNFTGFMYLRGRTSVRSETKAHEHTAFDWDKFLRQLQHDLDMEEFDQYLDEQTNERMKVLAGWIETGLTNNIQAGLLAGFFGLSLAPWIQQAVDKIYNSYLASTGKSVISQVFNDGRSDEAEQMGFPPGRKPSTGPGIPGEAPGAPGQGPTGAPIEPGTVTEEPEATAAQWSAILDDHLCQYCEELDGQIIHLTNPDYDRYVPGQIHQDILGWDPRSICRCIWVYTFSLPGEELPEETWIGLPEYEMTDHGNEIDEFEETEDEQLFQIASGEDGCSRTCGEGGDPG